MSDENENSGLTWMIPDPIMKAIRQNLGQQPYDVAAPILDALGKCQALTDAWLNQQGWIQAEPNNRKGRRAAKSGTKKGAKKAKGKSSGADKPNGAKKGAGANAS